MRKLQIAALGGTRIDGDGNVASAGAEDLGNGSQAVWQVKASLNDFSNGTAGGFVSDNTWVGLNGPWGKLALGQDDNPYDGAKKEDVHPYFGGTRKQNGIRYATPTRGGFAAAAAWYAGERGPDQARIPPRPGSRSGAANL